MGKTPEERERDKRDREALAEQRNRAAQLYADQLAEDERLAEGDFQNRVKRDYGDLNALRNNVISSLTSPTDRREREKAIGALQRAMDARTNRQRQAALKGLAANKQTLAKHRKSQKKGCGLIALVILASAGSVVYGAAVGVSAIVEASSN